MSAVTPLSLDDFSMRVIDAIAHPVSIKDGSFRIVHVNTAFEQLLGLPAADIVGKTDHELFAASDAEIFRARDEQVFLHGKRTEEEERITTSDGFVRLVASTRTPLYSAGHVSHLVTTCYPVARLREAGEILEDASEALARHVEARTLELRAAQAELTRKERLMILGQLASSLAHQIRNPLGAISNALALLRRQMSTQTQDVAKEALSIAQEEIWVANRIISDLLEYSRIQPPSRTKVTTQQIVERALLAEQVPPDVNIVQDVGDHWVYIDERQVRDAVTKLVRNACEAMDGRGTLTFSSRLDNSLVELAISDTGIGVRPETVGLVFEPLVTSKPLGMGLGLTTARALVINQGGTLECESELGKGAKFKLRLPIAEV